MKDTIVLYPSPGRSHLVPMVELGKLILTHHPSFSITIIISEAPFETGSTAPYIESVTATTPSINFYNLPTISLPNTTSSSFTDIIAQSFELPRLNNENYQQALLTLSKSCSIKALIMDFFCNPSFQVSTSLNIPTYYYHTAGISGLSAFLYLPTIHKNSTKSLKELNELINIPGLPHILSKDMPSPMLDRTQKVYEYFLEAAIQMPKSAGIIVNTVETLEQRALKAILGGECTLGEPVAPIYCVGPLIVASDGGGSGEDKHECLGWLDKQPSRSVVFLSFGSVGKFSVVQLKEMAIGLERSGVRFLWVVRTPPPEDETQRMLAATGAEPSLESFLPEGFLERTSDRGFVAKGWAPQVAVLSHHSVGGFVTHCGWNSVMEAFRAGVPMLAWPLFAEQNLNKLALVDELNGALPVVKSEDGLVIATELEKRVTELMDSENGKVVRERVMALQDVVLGAMCDGGPSRIALAKLVEAIKRG